MIWFVDTNALAKRYVNETGSQWLRREVAQHHVLLTQITPIEMMAALGRRFRKRPNLSVRSLPSAPPIFGASCSAAIPDR